MLSKTKEKDVIDQLLDQIDLHGMTAEELAGEGDLMWNDPTIRIDWETIAPDVNPLLSEKNGRYPAFDADKNYFDINGAWIAT